MQTLFDIRSRETCVDHLHDPSSSAGAEATSCIKAAASIARAYLAAQLFENVTAVHLHTITPRSRLVLEGAAVSAAPPASTRELLAVDGVTHLWRR